MYATTAGDVVVEAAATLLSFRNQDVSHFAPPGSGSGRRLDVCAELK
jgi:hypothetical protein